MSAEARHIVPQIGEPMRVLWTGRSGRRYVMSAVSADSFSLREGQLYALSENGTIRWVGMADDLIADPASRHRFRTAMREGASILTIPAPADDLDRMTLAWDLEGTHIRPTLDAA